MSQYFLLERGQRRYFQLPGSWQVLNNVIVEPTHIEKNISQMVSESIANPIGTLPLKRIIKPTDKVLIVADDLARATPKRDILTCLVDQLGKCGVVHDHMSVLFGGGTHRPLTEMEVEKAMGKELLQKIRYENHDCRSDSLVSIGRLRTGGEIKINRLLIEADFRIGIGSIIPHPWNGFGGGGKIILPGVSSYETIREHHSAYRLAKGASIGNIKDNPFYEEICEAARLANLDFIINAIYSSWGEVKGIVAGHFRMAHQFGVNLSLKELSVNINQDADVSILSAFPLDEGPQVMKPLVPATMSTKKGGTVILVANVQGGIPETFLRAFDTAYQMAKGDPKRLVLQYLKERKLIIENAPLDFNSALNLTLLNLSHVNGIIVSKDVSKDQAVRLGFRHADSLEEAISIVYANAPHAKVNIFSAGGLTVPVLKKDFSFGEPGL